MEHILGSLAFNTGNMAFLFGILETVNDAKPLHERTLGGADVKVWGCSNFIAAHRSIEANSSALYTDGKPLVLIGLGAQGPLSLAPITIPDATRDWISRVRQLAPTPAASISLRGQYTYDLLKANGLDEGTVVLGCPSMFVSPERHLGSAIRRKLSHSPRYVGVAPGNPLSGSIKSNQVDRWLVGLIRSHGGSYLVQHPLELLLPVLGSTEDQNIDAVEPIRATIGQDMTMDDFLRWCKTHGRSFPDVPSWLFHLRGLDIVVSSRIHGAQLALQAGTPAFCLAGDSRQIELCEILRVPHIRVSDFTATTTLEDVWDRLKGHDWDAYDANRIELARRYREFLLQNRLQPSAHLLSLV